MSENATNASDPADVSAPVTTPALRRRRRWWMTLILSLVIFGSGFVAGGAVALLAVREMVLHAVHHSEEAPARITAVLRRRLDLTDLQAERIEAILQERQAAFRAIRAGVQPRVTAELDLVEKQVAEVLDESQKEEWHERFASLRETWIPRPIEGDDAADSP